MKLKAFIIVFVSGFLISFPQNIIGCGGSMDPYDYYTSFFHQNLPDANGYRPFYYTGLIFLYDEQEPADVTEMLAKEWAGYCGSPVTNAGAKQFITKFSGKDIGSLYNHIEKKQPPALPDSMMRNSMAAWFTKSGNLEALGYILYAKQTEPLVGVSSESWEPATRDNVKMEKLIKSGRQLYDAAKSNFIKLRYGYQVVRLAHYSGNFTEALSLYDSYVLPNKTTSVLQPLSLALKAGALFRTGKGPEAAYLFSKAFSSSVAKRVSNYNGFRWSVNAKTDKEEYLALCKSKEEKADMLSLFAMGSSASELPAIKTIYQLNPAAEQLQVLAVREINKLEENYFSPALQKEKGGSTFYYTYGNDNTTWQSGTKEAAALVNFLHEASGNKAVQNPGLFETGAAYGAYLVKDFGLAKKYLASAAQMNLTKKVKDQWTLTNILLTITENKKIDAAFEDQMLPSMQWLQQRAKEEKPLTASEYEIGQWSKIYRDLLSEILARRYHQQGDLYKEALCIGVADQIKYSWADAGYSNGVNFMRDRLTSKDVEKLYALVISKQPGKFENFLLTHNSITQPLVAEFAGTAYLREYDYTNAIAWFKKTTEKKLMVINTNPFVDLLYDREEQLPNEKKYTTTKQAFAQTMLQLMQLAATDKVNAAKHYYKIANGLYNMTYYGHAWELVEYSRSGSDGYSIAAEATAFEKEFNGCYAAHTYFEKAMHAATDKNFKARCLFMMAKCSQKQISRPAYSDFTKSYDQLGKAEDAYQETFKRNRYFPELVKDYSKTTFYKEAYNSCSYLRDFVQKKK